MKKLFSKFKNMSKKKKIILSICSILVIALIACLIVLFTKPEVKEKIKKKKEPVVVKKLQIFNIDSKTRPIAVMINNHAQARPYHSGLDKAQIVYEFIVEGGITRMLAVFKDQNLDRIGPVRSSRHYYLDYAMENDAIYVHWGWSPQAEADIRRYGINNLNGLYDPGFTRDKNLIGKINLEHTAITSTAGINNAIERKGYRTEYKTDDVESELVLKYSVDEISLEPPKPKTEEEVVDTDSMVANNITIPYSNYMTASYTYDATNKYYLRYINGVEHKDYITGEQYHFKNILILKVENHTIDNYGRQTLSNVGSGDGYFITNGYARPIKWEKSSRESKTVYKYLDGSEVKVNDGNTFIQVEPINMTPTITE